MTTTASPTLLDLLPGPLTIGDPDVIGPLAVFPLFGAEPRVDYISFAEGSSRGVSITELPGGASVNDVLVINPLDVGVLLYEGEEILGAQQNRTVDAAVLVAANTKLQVPVSCVEHSRWDGSRHGEAFAPSPQAAFPLLRAAKSSRMRERLAAGMEARADQSEVWQEIDVKLATQGTASTTRAMSDAFDEQRAPLHDLLGRIKPRHGQVGAIAAISGRLAVLDHVSRPDVFATLFDPLVHGYALDALGALEASPPPTGNATAFLASAISAPIRRGRSAGLGTALHFDSGRTAGTGLAHDGELIQLSVYNQDLDLPVMTRIRRPSRRR